MKQTLTLFLFLISCKFSYSPYTVETPKQLMNEAAMKRILIEEPQVSADYKIAFVSDTHNYYDDLSDLVRAVNRNGPYAFVIVAGDITNEGLREEFLKTEEILGKMTVPHIVVAGNHDLLSNGEKIYERLFGQMNFVFTYKTLSFVFFNNNNWESGGAVPDFEFIEDSLAAAPTAEKILVTHVSPDDGERFSDSDITRFETIAIAQGVSFIFNGHNHNPASSIFGGATQVTIGAPSKRVYSELVITAGGLTHQKINF